MMTMYASIGSLNGDEIYFSSGNEIVGFVFPLCATSCDDCCVVNEIFCALANEYGSVVLVAASESNEMKLFAHLLNLPVNSIYLQLMVIDCVCVIWSACDDRGLVNVVALNANETAYFVVAANFRMIKTKINEVYIIICAKERIFLIFSSYRRRGVTATS